MVSDNQNNITAVPIHQNNIDMTPAIIELFSCDNTDFYTKENVLEKDIHGRTAIHAACYLGKSEILNYMINLFNENEKKEIALINDNDNCNPAHYACGMKWK